MPTQLTLPYDAPQVGDAWRHKDNPACMVCVCPQTGLWLYRGRADGPWLWASWNNFALQSKWWEPIPLEEVEA